MSSDSLLYLQQETSRLQEENRQLKKEIQSLRQYVEAVQALVEVVDDWDPTNEIMPLLDRILHNAMAVLDAKDGSLLVLDEETGELVFVLVHGDVDEKLLLGYRLPSGEGIAGWVAEHGEPTIVNNPSKDPRFYSSVDTEFDFRTESILAVPIVGGGRIMGVIEALNKYSEGQFDQSDQTLLMLLCRYAGELLHRLVADAEGSGAQATGSATKRKRKKAS